MNEHENDRKIEKKIRMKHKGDDIPDPEVIGQILDVVSERVPHLLKEISDVLYGEGRAKQYATSVATFYKELKAAGMTDAEAFNLTQQYMSSLNLSKAVGGMAHNLDIDLSDDE